MTGIARERLGVSGAALRDSQLTRKQTVMQETRPYNADREAEREHYRRALMLVHEVVTSSTKDEYHLRNAQNLIDS